MATDYRDQAVDYALRAVTGTDGLAFREVAERIEVWRAGRPAGGGSALDFGCGAGRSARFLRDLGFEVVGVDRSAAMLEEARRLDPSSRYAQIGAQGEVPLGSGCVDVVLSTWVLVELDTREELDTYLAEVARVLAPGGVGFVVTNTPEFYAHRWRTCEVDFQENRSPLRSGQRVKARLLPEGVIVEDTFWSDAEYRAAFAAARLLVLDACFPLAPADEVGWYDEYRIAPWAVYQLGRCPAEQ